MANEESTTLQNILAAGKEEFLEKVLSLLRFAISLKRTGVTTGAFYGLFSWRRRLLFVRSC